MRVTLVHGDTVREERGREGDRERDYNDVYSGPRLLRALPLISVIVRGVTGKQTCIKDRNIGLVHREGGRGARV